MSTREHKGKGALTCCSLEGGINRVFKAKDVTPTSGHLAGVEGARHLALVDQRAKVTAGGEYCDVMQGCDQRAPWRPREQRRPAA